MNSNWGVLQQTNTNRPLTFMGYEKNPTMNADGSVNTPPSGRLKYSFPLVQDPNNTGTSIPLSSTYRDFIGPESRYQIQLGIRYSFN